MSELAARFDLPLDVTAPAMARSVIRPVLLSWGFSDADCLANAELVVSELVSNAVRHGADFVSLDLQVHDGRGTIGVADGSAVAPSPRTADENGGRGIPLIELLGCRWGVHDHEGGKRVWGRVASAPPHERPVRCGERTADRVPHQDRHCRIGIALAALPVLRRRRGRTPSCAAMPDPSGPHQSEKAAPIGGGLLPIGWVSG